MNKCRIITLLAVVITMLSVINTTAFAAENSSQEIKGYIWNSNTRELREYYNSPDELLPKIVMTEADMEPYTNPVMPHGLVRAFHSYSPTQYTYAYSNNRFKIGVVRVDNSKNQSSPADLTFVVNRSGSCSTTLTMGVTYGGEVEAIFSKAELKFSGEVASTVSWSVGTSVGTNSTVPAGQIGKVTAYVIGLYSQGTAKYSILNSSTDELKYETVGIGGLIPTKNEWNLVVEIPCA